MNSNTFINLSDYERHAQKILPADVWAYVHGAAGDEITAARNVEAWQNILLRTRVLNDLHGGHCRVSLLGRTYPCPILAAPMAYQKLAHVDGENAMAAGCAAQGVGLVLSTQSSTALDEVAKYYQQEPERGPLWFQMYVRQEKQFNLDMIAKIEAAGFEAIVVTVDAPVNGCRDRERRTPLQLGDVSAVHLKDLPKEPYYQLDWAMIGWLKSKTKLPILLKGITHPKDALLARQHGASGVIVSNHGGRTLDTVAPTAMLLPSIAKALNGSLAVIVDGGIRRGSDVLKALALGASAVMVGRPLVYALACNGAYGVAHAAKLLKDEFEIAMVLSGCKTPDAITDDILFS